MARLNALGTILGFVTLTWGVAHLRRFDAPLPQIHEVLAPETAALGPARILFWTRAGDEWAQVVVSREELDVDPRLWTVRVSGVGRWHVLAPEGYALWIRADGSAQPLDLSVKAVDVSPMEHASPAKVLELLATQDPRLRALAAR